MSILPKPDTALATILDSRIRVQTSATQSHTIRAYDDEGRANRGVGDEWVDVEWNGAARSLTEDPGPWRGSLAVAVWVKAQPDGRAKNKIVAQIIQQLLRMIHRRVAGGYVFTMDASEMITPTTVNVTTGYSVTALNVRYRSSG